jgi:hypothetical protein
MKGRKVEGEKVRTLKISLKASIPYVLRNSHRFYNILHFAAFTTALIRLKKPSVARRAYRSSMPWG